MWGPERRLCPCSLPGLRRGIFRGLFMPAKVLLPLMRPETGTFTGTPACGRGHCPNPSQAMGFYHTKAFPRLFQIQLASLRSGEAGRKLLGKLQSFLLGLGKGFTFVGRQYRITLNNTHYRVDLVFYLRILRCFVLIEL